MRCVLQHRDQHALGASCSIIASDSQYATCFVRYPGSSWQTTYVKRCYSLICLAMHRFLSKLIPACPS